MTKDVAHLVNTTKTDLINPIVWKQIKGLAETMIKSKAMPKHIQNAEQAMVVMQAGYEMGMKPMQAINSLYIVNGQVTVWGKAIASQFIKHGYRLKFKDGENQTTVTATHKDGFEATETFTYDEAVKSGYTKSSKGAKFGWREGANRNIKLRYNALNKLAKTQCAEVLGSAVGVTEVYQNAVIEEETMEDVSQEDRDEIKATKTVKELTKLYNVMSKNYKTRTITPLFKEQREFLAEVEQEESK